MKIGIFQKTQCNHEASLSFLSFVLFSRLSLFVSEFCDFISMSNSFRHLFSITTFIICSFKSKSALIILHIVTVSVNIRESSFIIFTKSFQNIYLIESMPSALGICHNNFNSDFTRSINCRVIYDTTHQKHESYIKGGLLCKLCYAYTMEA